MFNLQSPSATFSDEFMDYGEANTRGGNRLRRATEMLADGMSLGEFIVNRSPMKIISTRAHGIMDYLMGVLLIAAPWLFGFARGGAETWIPVILGLSAIGYSLFTDYELGVSRSIPMKTHLALDIASGIFLALSPWIFGFSDYVYIPHLILGIAEVGAGIMTNPTPEHTGVPNETSS